MIGVIAKNEQSAVIREFFELFKTPWEFWQENQDYDILMVTENPRKLPAGKLIFLLGAERKNLDDEQRIPVEPGRTDERVRWSGFEFPLNKDYSTFGKIRNTLIQNIKSEKTVGFVFRSEKNIIVRLGFDIFDETNYLLQNGQLARQSGIPTVDVLIDFLRKCIVRSGVSFFEIPPTPCGFASTVCLTHDVDFLNLRDHFFDKTLAGFFIRSILPWFFEGYRQRVTWGRYIKNLGTVLALPLIWAGFKKDPWCNLERYVELEDKYPSTFFFLPHSGDDGSAWPGKNTAPRPGRAGKYDFKALSEKLLHLVKAGKEIGLHGIDAWSSAEKAASEKAVIERTAQNSCLGVRMHWLYFGSESPEHLERAGFFYDSTIGYNETVGFRAGTSQVYRLQGGRSIYELPMIIQDSTLFYAGRMGLDEKTAIELCRRIIDNILTLGGVLTVNWHQRSLSPERNWDSFYIELLRILDRKNFWFAKGSEIVGWFEMRREIQFEQVKERKSFEMYRIKHSQRDKLPLPVLRQYKNFAPDIHEGETGQLTLVFEDLALNGTVLHKNG